MHCYSKRTLTGKVPTITLGSAVRQVLPPGYVELLEKVFSRRVFRYEYGGVPRQKKESPHKGKRHYQTYLYRCQNCGIEHSVKSRTLEKRLMFCLNADCDDLMLVQGIVGPRGKIDDAETRFRIRSC